MRVCNGDEKFIETDYDGTLDETGKHLRTTANCLG
jgi:hypothetical protein